MKKYQTILERGNEMNKKIKVLSKIALLLVVCGFFQPVACRDNGFELANNFLNFNENFKFTIAAIGLYAIFVTALLSIVYTLVLLLTKKDLCSPSVNKTDFVFLLSGVVGGIITVLTVIDEFNADVLNEGSYLILTGWIASFVLLLLSNCKQYKS